MDTKKTETRTRQPSPAQPGAGQPPFDQEERRRSLRLRRTSLVDLQLVGLDRPSITIAETLDDYKQAFRLTHDAYALLGYIQAQPQFPYHYTVYHLLPETCLFVFKTGPKVIATLTEIHDTPAHGLPLDKLYKREVDILRAAGRRVVELSSFVTLKQFRMRNIMMYLCKAMFIYSQLNKVRDICVMVNPKHVGFYTRMLLFAPFGPERYYENVGAPAVALRVDMDHIEEQLRQKYAKYEFTEDLHAFFCRTTTGRDVLDPRDMCPTKCRTPDDVLEFFWSRIEPDRLPPR